MAPEQVRGAQVDHRSDIFSFGCVLYEMVRGLRPFKRDSKIEIMNAILKDEPPDLSNANPDLPAAFVRIVQRCLEKEPERRFQTASDLAFALENSSNSSSSRNLKLVVLPRGWREAKWAWAAGGALVAGLITAALVSKMNPATATTSNAHLAVALPEAITMMPNTEPLLTMSPDGSRVVFVGSGTNGTSQLWEQRFDQPAARPIPGTEGGNSPFFSPDSRWIGFRALARGNTLLKISADGGAPLAIQNSVVSAFHGASWAPDGNIFYAKGWAEGIWKADAAGKRPPVRVVNTDPAKEERAVIWPEILPDGKTLLYTVWTGGTYETAKLMAHSLVSDERREIVRGVQTARYVKSGHILFAREGSLYAIPFDAKRLVATGPERLLVSRVAMGVVEGEAHFGIADNGSMVYLSGAPLARLFRFQWLDRQGKLKPATDWNAAATGARLSPDGKSLATQVGAAGKLDVYTYDLIRGTPNKISSSGDDYQPLWTLDSKKLIFTSGRNGGANLFWRAADGSGPEEQLTFIEGANKRDSISPDGKLLLFDSQQGNSWDVWALPLSGERKPFGLLTNQWNESSAAISPDGKWLTYASDESGRNEVYVQSHPEGTNRRQISNEGGSSPLWARNGRELFYISGRKMIAVESVESDIFVPGKLKVLFEGDFYHSYDVSIDGKELLMSVRDVPGFNRFHWIQSWTTLLKD